MIFGCQCCVRAKQVLHHADAVILQQAQHEDGQLDREDSSQAEVVVLVEENGSNAALGADNAFHHGQHHPADRRILAQDIESLVRLPQE